MLGVFQMRQLPRISIIAFSCILLLAATGMVQAQTNVTALLEAYAPGGAAASDLIDYPLVLSDGTNWVPGTILDVPLLVLSDGTTFIPGAVTIDLTANPLVLSDGTNWAPNTVLDVPMPILSDGTTFVPGPASLASIPGVIAAPGDRDPVNGRMWLSNGDYYP
jgi:hypothetical protein